MTTKTPGVLWLAVAAVALAGCTSADGAAIDLRGPEFATFQEAMDSPGPTFEPVDHNFATDVHLKLLFPTEPTSAKEGLQPFVVLAFDSTRNAPVTIGSMALESRMPAMGHGTEDEKDPVHEKYGIYRGVSNHLMPGKWEVKVELEYPGNGDYEYVIDFVVR